MAVDNTTGAQGCNHYPNCNWAGHSSNYHLTPAQLETPVVTSMDYDLSMLNSQIAYSDREHPDLTLMSMRTAEMPINPNLTKALKLTNKSWNAHSV